ncbi:MAG TPA: glutaredoxin family protein [Polyangiaceae bacterium]|nr:glutaredoxin family protein [Polyangiaceae bacterium]
MLRASLVAIALLGVALPACREGSAREQEASAAAKTLPPLRFSDGTSDLMLTWIGPRGDTHVTNRTADVPERAKDLVRVVIGGSTDGTTDPIYVADLGAKGADGGYVANAMSRADWEAEIEKRRERAGAIADDGDAPNDDAPRQPRERAHGDPAPAPGPAPSGAPDPSPTGSAAPDSKALVIIYGASWCGPCHQALAYLKKRHVPAVFKDIEADPAAAREMRAKLDKSGGRTGAIPVIDVGGKIIVGYSEGALDSALRSLAGGTAL